jgi:hypothetical protein
MACVRGSEASPTQSKEAAVSTPQLRETVAYT